jgi:hypothetical protein
MSDHDYPKWITPHESHIERSHGDHMSAPLFPHFHVDRTTQAVTVMVMDEDEEAMAMAPRRMHAGEDDDAA